MGWLPWIQWRPWTFACGAPHSSTRRRHRYAPPSPPPALAASTTTPRHHQASPPAPLASAPGGAPPPSLSLHSSGLPHSVMAAVATVCSTQTLRFMPTVGLQRTRSKTTSRSLVSIDSEKYWTSLELKKSPASTWVCMSKPEDQDIVPPVPPPACCNQKETEEVTQVASETAKENATPVEVFQQIGPTKQMNRLIALGSVVVAIGLFASGRLEGVARPGLSQLSANAVPYEEALANGRPTVVEFYADWCEVCREMAKDVYQVEEEYRDRINFVMLNVDNPKWEPELDEFGVEGIPHFAFLDAKGNEEGNIVGRLPPKFLRENVMAMAKGEATVPHSSVVGSFSSADSRQAPQLVGPRSHSEN